jgi:signal peptidase I
MPDKEFNNVPEVDETEDTAINKDGAETAELIDSQCVNAHCPDDQAMEQIESEQKDQVDSNQDDSFVVEPKPRMSKFEMKKRWKMIFSKVISIIIWGIGICLLLLCISNLYQQIFNPAGHTGLFGIGEAVVASNSMEPKLYKNDLIFYKAIDPSEIEIEDIVVYEKTDSSGETILVVHEVINIGDGYVTTQGINNAIPDESFPTTAVVGKYMFKIGRAGVLLNSLSTPLAPLIIILLLVVIFVLRVALYYFYKKKIIHSISTNENTRAAIEHFFDI